jgi:hypothetical protein
VLITDNVGDFPMRDIQIQRPAGSGDPEFD